MFKSEPVRSGLECGVCDGSGRLDVVGGSVACPMCHPAMGDDVCQRCGGTGVVRTVQFRPYGLPWERGPEVAPIIERRCGCREKGEP